MQARWRGWGCTGVSAPALALRGSSLRPGTQLALKHGRQAARHGSAVVQSDAQRQPQASGSWMTQAPTVGAALPAGFTRVVAIEKWRPQRKVVADFLVRPLRLSCHGLRCGCA